MYASLVRDGRTKDFCKSLELHTNGQPKEIENLEIQDSNAHLVQHWQYFAGIADMCFKASLILLVTFFKEWSMTSCYFNVNNVFRWKVFIDRIFL